jgi:hypothetical protein
MTEKVAQAMKSVSSKVADAACAASHSLGISDGLLIAGMALLLASAWFTARRKFPNEWVKHIKSQIENT